MKLYDMTNPKPVSDHKCRRFAQARLLAIARYAGKNDRAKMWCL